MALSDDAMLARFGIKHAEPFDWGDDQPRIQMIIDDVKNLEQPAYAYADPNASLSGLDSIKQIIVKEKTRNKDDERNILQSLLADANVDLLKSVPSATTPATHSHRQSMERALMGDTLRDVSIKGLSDRAVAELTVESRTSLFGSILRLFDVPKEEEHKTDGSGSGSSKKKNDEVVKDASAAPSGKDKESIITTNNVVKAIDPATKAMEPVVKVIEPALKVVDPMVMQDPILSTAEIVRSVHLTAKPGDIPAGMDSKEYTMAVLHFLSSYVPYLHENESDYRTGDFNNKQSQEGWDQLRKTFPVLPLIKVTNAGESLELRNYGRVRPLIKMGQKERKEFPDSMDRDQTFRKKVLNLERRFSSSLPFSSTSTTERLQSKLSSASRKSSSSSNATNHANSNDLPFAFQRYVPRRKLVPHIEGGAKEELTLMISGHMQQPQHTPGPKSKSSKSKTATPSSKESSAVKSTSPVSGAASITKPLVDKEKGGADSFVTPSKRKVDAAADDTLHPLKKGKEFNI